MAGTWDSDPNTTQLVQVGASSLPARLPCPCAICQEGWWDPSHLRSDYPWGPLELSKHYKRQGKQVISFPPITPYKRTLIGGYSLCSVE